MNITTKYDIYQPVFFLSENKVESGIITRVSTVMDFNKSALPEIWYRVAPLDYSFGEDALFISKEELLGTL